MSADRILGPDEATRDGDRMTVTLTAGPDTWKTPDGRAVISLSGVFECDFRRDPATVITRPAPAEPDWQPGDVVRDALGRLFERTTSGWRLDGVIYRDELPARPLTRLVPEVKA